MQKIINVLSIASFVISASIAGAGVYVYANKDAPVSYTHLTLPTTPYV